MKQIKEYILEKASEKELSDLLEGFKKAWKMYKKYSKDGLEKYKNNLIKDYLKEKDFYNLWDREDGPWNEILGLVMDNLGYENFDDMYSIYDKSEIYQSMLKAYKELYQK